MLGKFFRELYNCNVLYEQNAILQCFIVGFTDSLTMSVSLQAIKSMGADFDGDTLNILHIINQAFFERCNIIFNPRNAMYISRIDGYLNSDLIVQRDTLINANTFMWLGRDRYSSAQLSKIDEIKARQKEYFKGYDE